MISQRHETKEKQDKMIFSWARSERKESDFSEQDEKKSDWIFLFDIRKEKAMLSVIVNSAWGSELINTMNKYVDVWVIYLDLSIKEYVDVIGPDRFWFFLRRTGLTIETSFFLNLSERKKKNETFRSIN
jgi:hypothetical protein